MKVAQQMDIVQQLESLREWGQNPLTKKDKFSDIYLIGSPQEVFTGKINL